ncbi:hypothetical protein M8J77_002162 [Diaphorina citri]|nr:hypothetical protein M8J77_002162 [Diaphorina citri]
MKLMFRDTTERVTDRRIGLGLHCLQAMPKILKRLDGNLHSNISPIPPKLQAIINTTPRLHWYKMKLESKKSYNVRFTLTLGI